ncbi:MAG: glycosyltransferase family 2 protein [Actinomycetota bacterium]|nr:glycosyltransferase family 2 protein [Actinomycetota bacterium]
MTTPIGAGEARERPRSLSVIIPIYNEEEILRDTVERVVTGVRTFGLDTFEVILCENGSTDSTLAIAHSLAEEVDEVKVVALDEPDYGSAMRAGFLAASGEAIVNFDADYYDLTFLEAALGVDADIVVAAKGLLDSHDARVLSRRVVSRSFGWLVRHILNVRVSETHGMKVFRRRAIAGILLEVRSRKDIFDTELIARAEWAGLRIGELPITTVEMRHSRSGIIRRIPRTMWGLVRMRLLARAAHAVRVRPDLSAPSAAQAFDAAA